MKDRDFSHRNSNAGCKPSQVVQKVQSFPSSGILRKNLNLNLNSLLDKLKSAVQGSQNSVYSYVVRTVKLDHEGTRFEQHGSGPNFQGDVLTLCTCKHQMRSRLSVEQWQGNVWIAGFTSRTIHKGKHWLFCLAKVESAHESQSDLWSKMPADSRNAKAAHRHYLGDLFEPTIPMLTGDARFSPRHYSMPSDHVHRKHDSWKRDINYQHTMTGKRPPLLVANPRLTFLWEEPVIYFAFEKHCRDYLKWSSLQGLIDQLGQEVV